MVVPPPDPFRPYLTRLESLAATYPPLKSFLADIKENDKDRKVVYDHYSHTDQHRPGRCAILQIREDEVGEIKWAPDNAKDPKALRDYLTANPAILSRQQGHRRVFILEDLDPDYVDVLGEELGVGPLVFSEQMDTWNSTDSTTIPYRGLPSISSPKQSFTLRYYEIRTLENPHSVDRDTLQVTFAVNSRQYERWRDIDTPLEQMHVRHAFVRRCASFWTSQPEVEADDNSLGWNAVIMIDPGMEVPDSNSRQPCYAILQNPQRHRERSEHWNASKRTPKDVDVEKVMNTSHPYHDGCPALASLLFPHNRAEANKRLEAFHQPHHRASPFDEQVFYWTMIASRDLIAKTHTYACNAAYFLLKHMAQHWVNQLELVNCTVAVAEWFSDDHQAKTDDTLDGSKWRSDLDKVNKCAMDINYTRRQRNHFWRAMVLNLERLGVQLGNEGISPTLPDALRDAQKDFLTIHARMGSLRERIASLAAMATDLASLQAAFKGTHDGEFSLRLGVFASAVFPVTLIASMLSMGDDFLPGREKFWVFWACSIPLFIVSTLMLRFGTGVHYLIKMVTKWLKGGKKKQANLLKRRNGRNRPAGGGLEAGLGSNFVKANSI